MCIAERARRGGGELVRADHEPTTAWLYKARLFTGQVKTSTIGSGRVESGWPGSIREVLKPPDPTRHDPTRPDLARENSKKS